MKVVDVLEYCFVFTVNNNLNTENKDKFLTGLESNNENDLLTPITSKHRPALI